MDNSLRLSSRFESERLNRTSSSTSFQPYARQSGTAIEAAQIIDLLQKKAVCLTGGRDGKGGPILLLPADGRHTELNEQELCTCFTYLTGIPANESARNGFTVLIDNRSGRYNATLLSILTVIQRTVNGAVSTVLLVQSDSHQSGFGVSKNQSPYGFELQHIITSQLPTICDLKELTAEFGGSLNYSHEQWINDRIGLERCVKDTGVLVRELDGAYALALERIQQTALTQQLIFQLKTQYESLINSTLNVIDKGRDFHASLQAEVESSAGRKNSAVDPPRYTLDQVTAMNRVHKCVQVLEEKLDDLEGLWDGRGRREERRRREEREQEANRGQKTELELAIKTVVDWILGPAEKLLASHADIGDSTASSEQVRKQHEQLEMKCTDSYGAYAELRHKVEDLIAGRDEGSLRGDRGGVANITDLEAQRNYMDTVCRSFAMRLERRRNLVITSVRFHRLVDELSRLLDQLWNIVSIEAGAPDVESAERALKTLQEICDIADATANRTFSEAQTLLDQLCLPVKDAFGKDITPDRKEPTNHVDRVVDELTERKKQCDELADVYRLKLQQVLQLRICERDAEQAIHWILDLCDLAEKSVDADVNRLTNKRENSEKELKKMESTAQSTYDYGKQLLQAALVTRRSLNYDLRPNSDQSQRLAQAWSLFTKETNELSSRQNTAADFARRVHTLLDGVDELLVAISRTVNSEFSIDQLVLRYEPMKEGLVKEQRLVRQAGLELVGRLQDPAVSDKRLRVDDSVVDLVESKLSEMNVAMSKLLSHWNQVTNGLHLGPDGQLIRADGRRTQAVEIRRVRPSAVATDHVPDDQTNGRLSRVSDKVGSAVPSLHGSRPTSFRSSYQELPTSAGPFSPSIQWSQFVQEAYQAIAIVKRIKTDLLPEPGYSSTAAGAVLYLRKLQDVNSLAKKVEVDIDTQLKVAEVLTVPKEKDREKEEIVRDLLGARTYLLNDVPRHLDQLNRIVEFSQTLATLKGELDHVNQQYRLLQNGSQRNYVPSQSKEQLENRIKELGDKLLQINSTASTLVAYGTEDTARMRRDLADMNGKFSVLRSAVNGETTATAGQQPAAPTFLELLTPQYQAAEGASLNLSVRVSGNPTPVVTWFHDDSILTDSLDFRISQAENLHTLCIRELFLNDSGTYVAKVENRLGQVSSSTKLTVKRAAQPAVAPTFLERLTPQSQTTEGDSLCLSVRVSGNPAPVVTWFRENKPLTDCPDYEISQHDNTYTLYIPEVFVNDEGTFTVKVENRLGQATSSTKLSVKSAVDVPVKASKAVNGSAIQDQQPYSRFIKPLSDQLTPQGQTISLECAIPPYPSPDSIRWLYNDMEIKPSPKFKAAYRQGLCTLSISNVATKDAGKYTCVAMVQSRPVSSSMTLLVEEAEPDPESAPVFVRLLANQILTPGRTAYFECYVTASPPPEIIWSRRGQPLLDKARYKSTYDQYKGHTSLTIVDVTVEDEGEYTCEAVNSGGRSSTSATLLRPELKPELLNQLHTKKNGLGKADQLSELENEYIPTRDFKVAAFEQNLRKERLSGSFDAVDNDEESIRQPPVTPEFLERLKNCKLLEGQDAVFRCRVIGNPRPNIQWYHNGRLIRPSSRYRMSLGPEGDVTLRVLNPSSADCGYYTCCATNMTGRDACSAELCIEGQSLIDETSYVAPEALKRMMSEDGAERGGKDYGPGGVSEVYVEPFFRVVAMDSEVSDGQTTRFDCLPLGRPSPDVTWFHNGVKVQADDRHKMVVNEEGVHSLIVKAATKTDAGMYRCVAKNRGGETEFTASLNVLPRGTPSEPRFVERLINQKIEEGLSVSLSTHYMCVPEPMISWQKNGQMIPVNSDRYRVVTEDGISTLYIKSAEAGDSAWYQCTAMNIKGTATTKAKLDVETKSVSPDQRLSFPMTLNTSRPSSERLNSVYEPEWSPTSPIKSVSGTKREPPTDSLVSASFDPKSRLGPSHSALQKYTDGDRALDTNEIKAYDTAMDHKAPWFVDHLKPLVKLRENDRAHFECRLAQTSDPNMKVEWFKDDELLQQGHRFKQSFDFGFATLDIVYTSPKDTGKYTCKATNKFGSASSHGRLLCGGMDWVDYETQLPEGLESIQRLQKQQNDKDHGKVKKDVQLSNMAPVFTVKLESQTVEQGRAAKFMVKVSGHPQPTLSWWVNGAITKNSLKYIVKFDGLMHVMEVVRAEENALIKVTAVNSVNEAECSAMLTVTQKDDFRSRLKQLPTTIIEKQEFPRSTLDEGAPMHSRSLSSTLRQPPVFTEPLVDETVVDGKSARLEVNYTGSPSLDVTWLHDGIKILSSQDFQISTTVGKSSLFIPLVFPEDAGKYTVRVFDETDTAECSCHLRIIEDKASKVYKDFRPEFKSAMRDATVTLEHEISFDCHVIGQPKPAVHWTLNGRRLEADSRHQMENVGDVHKLTLLRVQMEDAGIYQCVAANSVGQTTSKAHLNIKATLGESTSMRQNEPPKFVRSMSSVEAVEGNRAVFEVGIRAQPTPDVVWLHEGHPLQQNDVYQMLRDGDKTLLVISQVTSDTSGVYSCRATNPNGAAESSAELIIASKSSKPRISAESKPASVAVPPVDDDGALKKTLTSSVVEAVTFTESDKAPHLTKVTKTIEFTKTETVVKPPIKSSTVKETQDTDTEKFDTVSAAVPVKPSVEAESSSQRLDDLFGQRTTSQWRNNKNDSLQYSSDFHTTSTVDLKSQTVKHTSEWLISSDAVDGKLRAHRPSVENSELEHESDKPPQSQLNLPPEHVPDCMAYDKDHEIAAPQDTDDVFGSRQQTGDEFDTDLTFKPQLVVASYKEPLRVAVDVEELLQQEVERSMKVHEVETTDEITVETKVMEVKTVLMHLSTSGDISVTETTEVKTDTDMKETKKTREREELIMSHKTLDAKQLSNGDAKTPQRSPAATYASPSQSDLCDSSPHQPETPGRDDVTDAKSLDAKLMNASEELRSTSYGDRNGESKSLVYISDLGGDAERSLYVAVSSYEPEIDDVMSLHDGEKLEVLDNRQEDWWYVRKLFDDRQGCVPAYYLQNKQAYNTVLQQEISKQVERMPCDSSDELPGNLRAPDILQPLVSQHACDEDSVSFECLISGNPRPNIAWFHNSKLIRPSPDFLQFFDTDGICSLTIREAFPEDTGLYTVVVKNTQGIIACCAELTVHENEARKAKRQGQEEELGQPPTVITKPKAQVVDEGQTVTFCCRLSSSVPPQVEWLRDGASIRESSDCIVVNEREEDSLYVTSLTLNQVTLNSAGKYQICVTNDFGQVDLSVSLIVREVAKHLDLKGTLKSTSDSSKVSPRSDAEVAQHDFRAVLRSTGDEKPDMVEQAGTQHAAAPTDLIKETSQSTTVHAQTTFSSAPRRLSSKSERVGLYFLEHPIDCTVREGQSVRFACRVSSTSPPPLFGWFFQGKPAVNGEVYQLGQTDDGCAYLEIQDVYFEDAGVYTVRASTGSSTMIEASAILTVIDPVQDDGQQQSIITETPPPSSVATTQSQPQPNHDLRLNLSGLDDAQEESDSEPSVEDRDYNIEPIILSTRKSHWDSYKETLIDEFEWQPLETLHEEQENELLPEEQLIGEEFEQRQQLICEKGQQVEESDDIAHSFSRPEQEFEDSILTAVSPNMYALNTDCKETAMDFYERQTADEGPTCNIRAVHYAVMLDGV